MGDWTSPLYISSQVFVCIAYALFAYTYFVKGRITVLTVTMIGNVAYGICYGFLFAWTGMLLVGVALLRDITSMVLYQKRPPEMRKRITRLDCWLLVLWFVLAGAVTAVSWAGWQSLFAMLGTVLFTISIWQKNKVAYNFIGIAVSAVWIIYNVYIESVFGFVLESVFLVMVVIGALTSLRQKGKL